MAHHQSYMRRLHEPQHFYVVIWQNWNFRSSKEDPRQTLFKWFFKCFQNIGLGAEGFEASKRLRTLFMVSRILTKNGSLQLTFKGFNIYKGILILQILVLPNLYFVESFSRQRCFCPHPHPTSNGSVSKLLGLYKGSSNSLKE